MQVSPRAASFSRAASLLGLAALSLLGLADARPAAAQSYSYSTITSDDLGTPGSPQNIATGITNAGVVIGFTLTTAGPDQDEDYLYDTGSGAVTLINYQAANNGTTLGALSGLAAISGDGSQILGFYNLGGDGVASYFTDSGGHISALPDPFVLTGTDPTAPGAVAQYVGINSSGTTVGNSFISSDGSNGQSFIRRADGTLTTFVDPNISIGFTLAYGINSSGTTAGYYRSDSSGSNSVGFLRSADGTFTDFRVPGATNTYLYGLSDNGNLYGAYDVRDAAGNLVKSDNFTEVGGVFDTSVDIPGAQYTGILGINDAGQIAGQYGDSNGNYFGFYGNFNPVPEASSVVSFSLLLAFGLGGVVVAARRKKASAAA